MNYSSYYQAQVPPATCWFVTSILRSCEHVAFDRSLDVKMNLFEFFVAPDMEKVFLHLMNQFEKKGVVVNLQKLPNRLIDEKK